MKYIDYYYKSLPLEGNPCPKCGKRTWWVMKCNECGKVFCRYCKPEAFVNEDGDIEVTCDCGAETVFIDN